MSIITVVVKLSQALRRLSVRLQNKAITSIKKRITFIEGLQVKLEAIRSERMHKCHQSYYNRKAEIEGQYEKELAALNNKFGKRLTNAEHSFTENRRTIALVSQAASNELIRELVVLKTELDHLTK